MFDNFSISSGAAPDVLLQSYKDTIEKADKFLNLLHEFCDMGTAMRSVITSCRAAPRRVATPHT